MDDSKRVGRGFQSPFDGAQGSGDGGMHVPMAHLRIAAGLRSVTLLGGLHGSDNGAADGENRRSTTSENGENSPHSKVLRTAAFRLLAFIYQSSPAYLCVLD